MNNSLFRSLLKVENLFKVAFLFLLLSCSPENMDYAALDAHTSGQQVRLNGQLTDIMVADIFTPPVCSRIYTYPHIAAYEVLAKSDSSLKSFAGKLHGLAEIPQHSEDEGEIYFPLASAIAFITAARPLVFAIEKVDSMELNYLAAYDSLGISPKVKERSVAFGKSVGQHIIEWSAKDGYLERTAMSEYMLTKEEGKWEPTPPDYMPAIEPHWNTMRTLVIDSAGQFKPNAPTTFSKEKGSEFYEEAQSIVALGAQEAGT